MISRPARASFPFLRSDVVLALVCFGAGVLAWALWMRLGMEAGRDYPAWRVAGLALSLALVGLPVAWLNGAPSVMVGMPAALAVSAYFDWRDDETGLFMVGVLLLLAGSFLVTSTLAPIGARAGRRHRRQTPPPSA